MEAEISFPMRRSLITNRNMETLFQSLTGVVLEIVTLQKNPLDNDYDWPFDPVYGGLVAAKAQ